MDNYSFGVYYDQRALIEADLNLSLEADMVILMLLKSVTVPEIQQQTIKENDRLYYWFSANFIAAQLPRIFKKKSENKSPDVLKQRVRRIMRELEKEGLLVKHPENEAKHKSYYTFLPKISTLIQVNKHTLSNLNTPLSNLNTPPIKFEHQLENNPLDRFIESTLTPKGRQGEVAPLPDFMGQRVDISGDKTLPEIVSLVNEIYEVNPKLTQELTDRVKSMGIKLSTGTNPIDLQKELAFQWASLLATKNYRLKLACKKKPTRKQLHESMVIMVQVLKKELGDFITAKASRPETKKPTMGDVFNILKNNK